MEVTDAYAEHIGPTAIRVTLVVDLAGQSQTSHSDIGEGPTGRAVPDKIVKYLIERDPEPATLRDIQREVGGNAGTASRQAWTLATNAPDLQLRLRGWVRRVDRGLYQLTPAARARLKE